MNYTCSCGKFHYSTDHFFDIHGDYLGRTPEHRIQVPILPNGKLYDAKKIKDNEPFPVLTWKWVCKECGNFNTSENPDQHKKGCAFITYLQFRETEPFKGGVKSVKTPTGTTTTGEKPDKKPKPDDKPSKYEPTDKEKEKINEYRNQLLNILIKYEYDFSDEPDKEDIIKQFKEERKDRPVGWFWEELKRISEIEKGMTHWSMWRKYAQWCQMWEDLETGASFIYQPEKKRRMLDWYLLGKLSYSYLLKLQSLVDKNDKPKLDPAKKYLLSDLLLLIPKRKKPKPKPQNAPLAQQIERFQKEYYERLVKYVELDMPLFFPENEVDRIGKQEKYWKENSWRDYLENAKDTQNDSGVFTDLEQRQNTLKTIFAKVVIERLIDKKNKHGLESFIKNYDQEPETTVLAQEPHKTQIENILLGADTGHEPPPLWDKPKYYDELYNYTERNNAKEWLFSSLTLEQWNELDKESELRKGVFELRNFPNLKKLKIRVNRPYLNAPIIKKIDLSATADDLEELDLSQCEGLTDLILGKKPLLKKIDCRWTSLKKLNLKNTALQPKHYDTLSLPARMKSGEVEPPARKEKETDEEYNERLYQTGKIVWPFENFTGDPALITLPKTNIAFNIPWIRYGRDWSNISNEFKNSSEYIQDWYDNGFNYETAQDWFKVLGKTTEKIKQAGFCKWLRDIQKKNSEWVLNHGNIEELWTDYIRWIEENKA